MIGKQTIFNICKQKCGSIVPKCRYKKKMECYYFRCEVNKHKEILRQEMYKKSVNKYKIMPEGDFYDSIGNDISKQEFFENETMFEY
jgi:hypothetical protein